MKITPLVFYIFALVFFALASFNVAVPRVNFQALGLLFLTLALANFDF